jgi:uncharacterized protein (TIGR01777 family)
MKKVVIAGGTGFIGTYLSQRFLEKGYFEKIVSRNSELVSWNENDLKRVLEGAELVINLAGKNINCRHTDSNRKAIIDSRINTTRMIGNAIQACENPPKLWINASAVGIYKPSVHRGMTEDETETGTDFPAQVVTAWEKTFFDFKLTKTRQIALRTSVVLGKNGGALTPLIWLTRFGLGGMQGKGNQVFSWIHIEDYFRVLLFAIENTNLSGVINCTSPEPLPNRLFMRTLRRIMHIRIGLNAPELAIKLGAKLIGTEPELILNSSYIVPKRLVDAGFKFSFPQLSLALDELLN